MRLSELLKSLVNLLMSVVGVLLGFRFVLKLFAANPGNDFVNWVYRTSAEVLGPFRTMFPTQNVDGHIFEFSTLFALLVYGILAMLAFAAIDTLTPSKKVTKKR